MKRVLLFMVFLLVMSLGVIAQPLPPDTTVKVEDDILSLEDLMKVKITVASRNEQTLRETPGVVTIITGEEIRNSGARDLIDVFRLVPGFDFAQDLDGIIGMGVRGNWAQEAKILLKIDGVDVVETAYGSLQFGSHYPVSNIDHIEIIRGPGSTMYGGNASLAVINIITRDGKKVNGIGANVTYGQLQNTFARRTFSVGGGREFKNGIDFSVHLYAGQANMSDHKLKDTLGNTINYADSSRMQPLLLNAGLKYKGFEARYILDNYKNQSTLLSNTYLFNSHLGALSYTFKVNDKLSIIPRISFKNQLPWFYLNKADTAAYNTNVRTGHYTGSVQIDYKPLKSLEIIGGGEYYYDMAATHSKSSSFLFMNGKDNVHYYNVAGFLQAQYFSKWVNLTAGVRYDKHNRFGGVVVPRVVLTKLFGKFHAKLMYSKAFRAPMIFNMDVNPNIKPEYVTVYEAEIGMLINDKMYATLNIYDNNISSPIVYSYINDVESYYNGNHIGSRGVEFEYRYKDNWGNITANYSYYYAYSRGEELYAVPGIKGFSVAFPAHKATISSSFNITKKLSVNPVGVFYSPRYGFNDRGEMMKFNPTFLLSTYINYENIVKGFSAGFGVFDILGQNYQFAQAYRSYSSPQPGTGREVMLRLKYKFSFND